MMKWLFKSPSYEEIIHLLAAWRIWLVGAVAGGLIACLVYVIAPPPYRSQATVLIDHNIEQVIPVEDDDTKRFYYLQEENDKLVEIAWSDQVLEKVTVETGISVSVLKADYLQLGHPGDGGWHLMAESRDAQEAQEIASAWGQAFVEILQQGGPGVNPLMEFKLVQAGNDDLARSLPIGTFLFLGSIMGVAIMAFLVLFIHQKEG